ncbi:MAG: hypothetical protein C4539_08965 [Ignavibacteriales bacterium]|nr:MAG: hypothetical protein C4539_08965 [Ignavibacteriales bacterium]
MIQLPKSKRERFNKINLTLKSITKRIVAEERKKPVDEYLIIELLKANNKLIKERNGLLYGRN